MKTSIPTTITTPPDCVVPSFALRRPRPRWRRLLPSFIPLAAAWGVVVVASVKLYVCSGAFWRDELSSIILAQLPTMTDMYANLERDSAPLLFACLVKVWMALGAGDSHAGLALLGFVVYGGIGGALCWATRSLGVRLPLLGSVFLLANGTVFFWGTSIRSYGLAALLAAVLVGCVWRFISAGSMRWWMMTALSASLCAQANYQNTYVIFSVCTAGAFVCAVRRQWWRSAAALLSGVCSAMTLIPYYPVIVGASAWQVLLTSRFDPLALFFDSLFSLGSGRMWLGALWMVFPIYLVSVACRRGWSAWRPVPLGAGNGRILFAGMTLLLLALSMPLFVWKVGRGMTPWYFLPSFTVLACFLDLSLQQVRRRRLATWGIAGTATLLLLAQTPVLFSNSNMRRTNLDILATQVGEQATPGDVIIVSSLYVGQAFKYYYRGAAAWMLVPGLTSQDIDTMDGAVILALTRQPQAAISYLHQDIERTLRSGNRVWIVGTVDFPPEGKLPQPPTSLKIKDSLDYWYSVVGLCLQQHAANVESPLPSAISGPVMPIENLPPVSVYSGWRM